MPDIETKIFLSEMKPGSEGIIFSFANENRTTEALMEMGLLLHEKILVERVAPLGDPMIIFVSGNRISIRKNDAANICVLSKI
jgi:ferrous iron transport protein A